MNRPPYLSLLIAFVLGTGGQRSYAAMRGILRRCSLLLLATALTAIAQDPAYDPPAGYYDGTNGLVGSALQTALNTKVKGHHVVAYGTSGTVPALRVLDALASNPTQVALVYWDTGRAASSYGGSNGQWNHEHCWPQSFGVSNGPGNSDLFNLRPADVQANAERGNLYYAEITGGTVPTYAPLCRKTASSWMPRNEEKGMLARAAFYMAVRYDGGETTPDLRLSDTPSAANNTFGRLSDFLTWHRQYPVTEAERLRNHTIYTTYQFNRNPFVDDPDFAELVFRGLPVVHVTAIRKVATEGGTGSDAAELSVSRRGPTTAALSVALAYGGTTASSALLSAPSSITIAAGSSEASLVLAAAPNPGTQGERTLTVTAAASPAYTPVDAPITLTITDAAATTFGTWASTYGLSGAAAAASADPDGDGWSNAQEYAFGLPPQQPGGSLVQISSGSSKITWLQRADTTYVVRQATDLATGFVSTVTATRSNPQPTGIPAGYEQYEAGLPTGQRGFLRVEATLPP